MRLAIVGSRKVKDRQAVVATLDDLRGQLDPKLVISGGAIGVDSIAEQWAKDFNIPVLIFKPEYDLFPGRLARIAPLARNRRIVAECDMLLAFWDRKGTGTAYTIRLALEAGKTVKVIEME